MSDLDQLPSDLDKLFRAEASAYPNREQMRARVRRRIEASVLLSAAAVGGGALATTANMSSLSRQLTNLGAKKTLLLGTALVGLGVGAGELHGRSVASHAAPQPAAAIVAAAPPSASATEISVSVESLPVAASAKPSSAASVAPASLSTGSSTLAQEQSLVDTARAALTRGRAADAFSATEEHARTFPNGRLSEDRENLAISALMSLGRKGEATARLQRFHKRFPKSLYGGTLDTLVGGPNNP
jgi:TolA-binding protein